jgi:uncharacterized membrane protein YdjX (TVP38/TMEM64 family)
MITVKSKFTYKIKVLLFIVFAVAAILMFRFSPISGFLQPQPLKEYIGRTGYLAPFVFIIAYAGGICLFLPATLFIGIGAMLFGPLFGFIYNVLGAMFGASTAFLIGRYLGRDFAASLIGSRLERYDQKIAENGFSVTLYLRLVFFPFSPLNFGMGLTRVTFGQYFWGTFFGILVADFAVTFFFATLSEGWSDGPWERLWNWRSLVFLALFVGSFFIPKIVRKFRPEP